MLIITIEVFEGGQLQFIKLFSASIMVSLRVCLLEKCYVGLLMNLGLAAKYLYFLLHSFFNIFILSSSCKTYGARS